MESLEVKYARLEEKMVSMHGDIKYLRGVFETVAKHDKEIAIIRNDKRWVTSITHTISGLIGSAIAIFFGGGMHH